LEDHGWKEERSVGTPVQEIYGGSSGVGEGSAVVPHKVRVIPGDGDEQLIDGPYVEDVILLGCFQEPFGEGPDGMVRRGRGEGIFLVWSLGGVSLQGFLMELKCGVSIQGVLMGLKA